MKKWKSALQYFLMLAATVFLVWFSFNSLTVPNSNNTWADKINYLQKTWQQADMQWLWLMAALAMVSHLLRAQRWKMLITASGNSVTLLSSFLSLMIGYLVNLVIPRGGEVSRCLNLLKLHKTPVETSLGTVVVERIADVIFLLIIIALAFFIQADMLLDFMQTLPIDTSGTSEKVIVLLIFGVAGILLIFLLWRWLKSRPTLYAKWKKLLGGFQEGLQSVIKLKSKGWFLFHSIAIWALYFVMTYCVLQAFESTQNLGTGAILSVFALGSIAMALPLPGGAGAYHTLVPAGITFLYKIPSADAIAFVFIFYAWQTLIMIVGGAVSMVVSSLLISTKSK
ncbi:MAG: lysylphosphatidylglycerol synthase transmembrane domain-containing protein [Cytophagales bacterium]|nr:lysylphosphatidylglycerol synthase transmembrane domain-containing protein [Cytophagales bacterium]